MQWAEVRTLFPNTFVPVEDQRSHIENGEWHVDEVAVIRPLPDGNEALAGGEGGPWIDICLSHKASGDRHAHPFQARLPKDGA